MDRIEGFVGWLVGWVLIYMYIFIQFNLYLFDMF